MELNAENIINEIQSLIKALKDCGGWVKRGNGEGWFNHEILADALALINSQEQRIGKLAEEVEDLKVTLLARTMALTTLGAVKKELTAENERLHASCTELTRVQEENERLTRLANLRQRDLDNANDLLFKAEDKICEGRMVELPCKVGDTVWEVWASGSDITQIQRGVRAIKVDLIYINQYDTIIHCISEEMAGHIPLSDFGKTVFLTPEEANKKLKELENEN